MLPQLINNPTSPNQILGRHNYLAAGTYTSGANGNNSGKQRTVVCYNCKGEGHMSKQCTKPKRKGMSHGDNDEEEEAAEEDGEEEEEHLAPGDSAALPAIDLVSSAEETEPFETDESAATPPPRSPRIGAILSSTRLYRARISVRPHTPPSLSTEALIVEYASAPTL
nr:hypothetical protein [Tanacetum cinerariifolium]